MVKLRVAGIDFVCADIGLAGGFFEAGAVRCESDSDLRNRQLRQLGDHGQ